MSDTATSPASPISPPLGLHLKKAGVRCQPFFQICPHCHAPAVGKVPVDSRSPFGRGSLKQCGSSARGKSSPCKVVPRGAVENQSGHHYSGRREKESHIPGENKIPPVPESLDTVSCLARQPTPRKRQEKKRGIVFYSYYIVYLNQEPISGETTRHLYLLFTKISLFYICKKYPARYLRLINT